MVGDIDGQGKNDWVDGTFNPDHKLVEIHSANYGFQSKLNTKIGSYMLYEFVERQLKCLNSDKEQEKSKCIFEIFDDIQAELEEIGKQKIIST